MTSSMPPIKIHVLDPDDSDDGVPLADVGVVTVGGQRHLFLSPQSFGSAVRQVSSAMPDLPLEQVERLVREHCTELKDFDELLGPIEPAPPVDFPPPPADPPALTQPRGRAKKWAIAAALLPAFAGTWALGHFTSGGPVTTAASAPDGTPSNASDGQEASDNRNLGPEPFTAREFMDFSDAGKIDCSPIDNLEAECTDADGMVMATKAATGPDSTIFTFSYGPERLGLRIFGTADYAETWTQQVGSRELYPNMVRSGRYVLWGTDKSRLKEYLGLLESSQHRATTAASMHTMGMAEPLPPRLAALTLGTLGLDEQDVRTILFTPQSAPVDASVLMAAQAVLGVTDDPAPPLEPGAEDIVALAAGIEPQPAVTDTTSHAAVVPVTDPVESPGSTSEGATTDPSTGAATGSDQEPAELEKTTEPVVEEKPEEPVAEKPTEPEPAPDPDPTPEVPPTEPVQPIEPEQPAEPAEPTPVDPPVTETPAPPQDPEPGESKPPADAGHADDAGQLPAADERTPADGDQEVDGGGELLALAEAWIAPAA